MAMRVVHVQTDADTTSREEVRAGHHENVGILEMLARRGVKLLKFLLIGQAHLDDLWAHAAYQVGSWIVPRECAARIHPGPDFHGYVLESRLAVEPSHPAAEVGSAPLRENATVKISHNRSNAGWGG